MTGDIDASRLPVRTLDSWAPIWWGQTLLCMIEGTLFIILCIVYMYLRSKFNIWPPPGTYQPMLLPTASLVLLLASCLPMYHADESVKKDEHTGVIVGQTGGVLLGLLAFGLRVKEWLLLDYKWNSHAYGSIVYSMLGLHTFDLLVFIIESVVFIAIFATGRAGMAQKQGIRIDTITWYFVVGIWVPCYILIYLYPWLLQR